MAEQSRESERLTRLEEAALFADRRLDELHDEMLALSRRVEALSARLRSLELAREAEAERAPDDRSEAGDAPPA